MSLSATRPPVWRNCLRFLLLCMLLTVALSLLVVGRSMAQQSVITAIEVVGTSDLETSQILVKLESQIGQTVDRQRIIRDIKAIYQMGLFSNVQVETEQQETGFLLRFVVTERPRIQTIRLSGARLISEEDLKEAIQTKDHGIYDPAKIKQDENIIRGLYRKEGYVRTKVSTHTEAITEKKYRVDFVIEETPQVFLTNIHTKGNQLFSELDIKRFITSAEIDCFSWFNESGIFNEERVNQDLALIAQNYLTEGYIKVFIDKPRVLLFHNPEFSRLEVFLNINEGQQYFTGKVDISGDLLLNKEALLALLELKEGSVYNPFLQNQDRAILNEVYQEQGYAFVRVIPRPRLDDQKHIVDVTYHIEKKEKAYIGRVEFSGNVETRDFVIRREFEVKEGELYNGKKLKESQDNLERLAFFEPGLILEKETTEEEDNILDVIVSLKEAQTGTFQAQLGYSEVSKLSAGVSYSKINLFGRGQKLSFDAQFAQEGVRNEFSVTFTEPRVFGSHFSSSVTLFRKSIASDSNPEDDRIENGFSVSVGYPVYRRLRFSIRFSTVDRLFVHDTPSIHKRSIAPSLTYNTQNHPIFPNAGINTAFTIVQTGGKILGGNTQFREYDFRYRQFWAFNKNRTLVLMAQTRLGFLEKIGSKKIPREDRYRIGGIRTVRGHDFGAIAGPYDRGEVPPDLTQEITKLQEGGIFRRIFNLELVFPLENDPVSNIRGVVFYDAGNVNAETEQYAILDKKEPGFFDLRHSAGIGIRLITPIGVLRFEFGQKLDQRQGESPDKFNFTISGLF